MKNVRKLGWTGLLIGVIMFTLGFCTGKLTNNGTATPAHSAVAQKREPLPDDATQRRLDENTKVIAKLADEVGAVRRELGSIVQSLAQLHELVSRPLPAPAKQDRRRG